MPQVIQIQPVRVSIPLQDAGVLPEMLFNGVQMQPNVNMNLSQEPGNFLVIISIKSEVDGARPQILIPDGPTIDPPMGQVFHVVAPAIIHTRETGCRVYYARI